MRFLAARTTADRETPLPPVMKARREPCCTMKEKTLITSVTPHLQLFLAEDYLPGFYPLLQSGVRVQAQVGKSVHATFVEEFGLNSQQIDQIQTVFLDGKAVDDLDAAVIRDDSTLGLSSAMPGLVGATLRRGSYYAAMRSQITAAETLNTVTPEPGMITLKLFNLVLAEFASLFLRRGVWIEKETLHDFLATRPGDLWRNCRAVLLDGDRLAPAQVAELSWPDATELICLSVTANGDGPVST